MKSGIFNRRIPTVFALLILVIIIGVSTFLIQQGVFYVGKASPDTQPQNFSITNITDSSFTVIFTTTGSVESVLNIDNANTGNSITFDDRDKKTGIKNKYYSHHLTVQNLNPEKTYSFQIVSGTQIYSNPLYTVKTGASISSPPPNQKPISGKVLLPNGNPGKDVVIAVQIDQAGSISTITDNNGEFIIPVNSLRKQDGNSYMQLTDNTLLTITAFRESMKAEVKSSYLAAQNLPAITLLQEYVFIADNTTFITEGSRFPISYPTPKSGILKIIVPKNGETFTDLKPLFRGTSQPNIALTISAGNTFNKLIKSNSDGIWSYRPENDFQPGRYVLKIDGFDASGNPQTVTSSFAIFPQGSQIAASELRPTTSVTLTPSLTPTTRPATPTIPVYTTVSPTPTKSMISPTISLSPTPTLSPTPSLSPTPTSSPTITPTSEPTVYLSPTRIPSVTQPGSSGGVAMLTGISVILIMAGIALLFAL